MAVTFIIGRAGSGKTARCFGQIRQMLSAEPLGAPIFLVVPNQATFQVEREMMASTGGFSRLVVVSFDLLGRHIAVECGDAAVPEVTSLGRQLILGHLLRRHQAELRFFGNVAHQPGMAAELDATFAELERSGKTDADLARLVETLSWSDPRDAQGPSLQAKLRDLRFLYDAYQKYLGQDRLDQHRRLRQALSQLEECAPLGSATVFVDDFYSFTEYERRLLAGLGRVCSAVEINLMMDPDSLSLSGADYSPDEMSLFHRTERAYVQLRRAMDESRVEVNEVVRLAGVQRSQSPDLNLIEREMFSGGSLIAGPRPERDEHAATVAASGASTEGARISSNGLQLIEAPDPRAEVDAAARGIVDLLRQGHRLRDVAVLARDLGPYQQLIDTSFPEHGLSALGGPNYYFVDRRRSAEHHPLLAFVRAMFQIVLGRWRMPAVMSFLKTGLAGVGLLEADEIENYLIQHRLVDAPWDDPGEWAYERKITAPSEEAPPLEVFDVRDVEAMRRGVVGGLQPFIDKLCEPGPLPLREIATAVFGTFERFNVRGTLSAWAVDAIEAKQPEQGAEHEQVWAEVVDLFEQMVDLLGDELVGVADFVDILEWGLERFTLAITPPTVDQVLVGQIGRTRTPEVKAVFLLGMNEGQFPRAGRDESILSRWERRELKRLKLELDPDSDRQRLDEHFLGYIAVTRASQLLIVSRALSEEGGRPTYPSVFWRRLRDLLPAVQSQQVPRETLAPRDIRRIATPRQLVGSLMQWAREERLEGNGDVARSEDLTKRVAHLPSFGTPGEGQGEGLLLSREKNGQKKKPPHPNPLPEYRERENSADTGFPATDSIDPDPRASLYHWLATHYPRADGAEAGDAISALFARAWKALSYSNDARLSPAVAGELFPTPLQASVTQIETFAACPFRHFVRYGIRLTGRDDPRVTGLDMSQVYHRVLQYMTGEMLNQDMDWSELPAESARKMILSFSGNIARDLRGEVMLSSARNKYLLTRIERTLERVVASLREMQSRGNFRPADANLGFGQGGKLPAYHVRTPGGANLQLSGRIDRIDLLNADTSTVPAVAVYDYKLSAPALSMDELLHGLSLQLLTYLMVLQSQGEPVVGKPLTPAAAFYYPLLRRIRSVSHPSEALEPSDPLFNLSRKPRGIFDARFFPALDNSVEPGETSHVVQARLNKDGQQGNPGTSDFVTVGELNALFEFAHLKLGKIGDQIMAGNVDVRPYRMGKETPCPRCEYRDICRFEPGPGSYRHLMPKRRQEALVKIIEETQGGNDGS